MLARNARRRFGVLLAGLVLVGACSSGGDEAVDADGEDASVVDDAATTGDDAGDATPRDDAGTDPSTGSASDSPPPEEGGTDPAAAAPDAQPGEQPPATPAPSAPAATPAATPAPIVPRAGTYTYERTTTNEEGTETERSDQIVSRLSGDDTAARLQIEQDSSQGRITSQASAGPDGILVESSVIESQVGEINCDWDPDWLFVGAWVAGQTWTIDTACEDTVGGLQVDVTFTGTGRIVGVETVTVGGRTLDAWVVETQLSNTANVTSPALSGSSTSSITDRSWIDPATGMAVRSESQETTSGDFGNSKSTIVSELVGTTA